MREKSIATTLVTSAANATGWVQIPASSTELVVVFNAVSGGTAGDIFFQIESAQDSSGTGARRLLSKQTIDVSAVNSSSTEYGLTVTVTQAKPWIRLRSFSGPAGSTFTAIRAVYRG